MSAPANHDHEASPYQNINANQNKEVKQFPLFHQRDAIYCRSLAQHMMAPKPEETLVDSLLAPRNGRAVIAVRNHDNDELIPFDAEEFLKRFDAQNVHPVTQEALPFLEKRFAWKKRCLKLFGNDFLFPDRDQDQAQEQLTFLLKCLDSSGSTVIEEKAWVSCCETVELSTFENLGYIWTTIDLQSTNDMLKDVNVPEKTWLLRKSSRQGYIMPNAEVFVLACKTSANEVWQQRCVYVYGVGIYEVNALMPLYSFRALYACKNCEPDFVTLGEMLSHHASSNHLQGILYHKPK